MPGYDRTRIVGRDSEDLDEFTCAICQDILNDPMVAKCCRQLYCRQCIEEWLSNNNTCPTDRTSLRASDLTSPPRIITNMISKMKIKCENWQLGCDSVVTLEEIKRHSEKCQYGLCPTCKTSIKSGDHDCMENLLIQIESLKIENNDLRMKNSKFKNNQAVQPSGLINTFQNEAKNCNSDNYVIEITIRIPPQLKISLTDVCKEMVQNYEGQPLSDFCKHFGHKVNSLRGSIDSSSRWSVIAFVDQGGESYVPTTQYFRIRFGKVIFEIYK